MADNITNLEGAGKESKILAQIMHRKSVRTFKNETIRVEDREKIISFANSVTNPYDIKIDYRLLNAKEHKLSSPVLVGAVLPCVSPLGYPAEKKSVRETMMRKGIKADSRIPFEQLFFEGALDHPLTKERAGQMGQLADILEMVRWAPSAVNKQPWRVVIKENAAHFYEKKDKGYTDSTGWDIQKIDMGIALSHFCIGAEERHLETELVIQDPGIAVTADMKYIATVLFCKK